MNVGIIVRTDNTFDRVDLGRDVMGSVCDMIGTKAVDVVNMNSFDVWTEETSDDWERRWITGPPLVVNTLATSLVVHCTPHKIGHRALYGTVVITGRTVDDVLQRVSPDGMTWWDVVHVSKILGMYRDLYGETE